MFFKREILFYTLSCHPKSNQISAKSYSGPDPHVAGPKAHFRCGAPSLILPVPSLYLSFLFLFFCSNPSLLFPSHSLFEFSFLYLFQFFFFFPPSPFFPFLSQYLNAPPGGPAWPPEARDPRHVPLVPLWGSGTFSPEAHRKR